MNRYALLNCSLLRKTFSTVGLSHLQALTAILFFTSVNRPCIGSPKPGRVPFNHDLHKKVGVVGIWAASPKDILPAVRY